MTVLDFDASPTTHCRPERSEGSRRNQIVRGTQDDNFPGYWNE